MRKTDQEYLIDAAAVAGLSRDPSRQVGCVIVSPDGSVVVAGYNRLPRGVEDTPARRERPAKYLWTEHAERVALYEALRQGHSTQAWTMYLPWFPCADCARGVIESGIVKLVCGQRPDLTDPQWGAGFAVVETMLAEAGVVLSFAA